MQERITIKLPESPEVLQRLVKMLEQYGLISGKKAKALKQEREIVGKQQKKSRWGRAAERLQAEAFLKGKGEEVKKLTRDFREDFSL